MTIEKEIITLKKEGMEIHEIANHLNIDTTTIREILNNHQKTKIIKTQKIKTEKLFDNKKNINTTLQIEIINKEAWKLYEKAMSKGKVVVASNILQTIMKQIELTSKKLGELNKKDDKNKKIPPNFIEYFNECLENEEYFKKTPLKNEEN